MNSSAPQTAAGHRDLAAARSPGVQTRARVVWLTLLLQILAAPAQELRITEFLASNAGGLRDADGDSPDWIEIHNPTEASVELTGWHLTDVPDDLTRWTFPATHLAAGGYLVVFASGKDRSDASGELHANFQLAVDGEFLALVQPDGVTVAHAYSPRFPPQRANASYGIELITQETILLAAGAPARVLIPLSASELPADWMTPGFADHNWTVATTGMGFDPTTGASNLTLRVDINSRVSAETGAADTELGWDTLTLAEIPKTIGGVVLSLSPLGGATLEDRDRSVPVDMPPEFTQDQLYDDFVFALGSFNGAGLRLDLEGLPPHQDFDLTVWSYDGAGSGGIRVSDWIEVASGITNVIADPYQYDQSIQPTLDGHDTFGGPVRSSSSGRLRIEGRRSGGVNNGVYLNAFQLTPPGYGSLISFDLGPAMRNRNASACIRLPFMLDQAAAGTALKLRMKYDDGFVAWLNGHLVAARNAPAQLEWNSAATTPRSRTDAVQFEAIPIALSPGLLVNGENVLAIQGLNVHADDPDFLIAPELFLDSAIETAGRYFHPPTPRTPNGPGYPGFVADTKFSADRGFHDQPLEVTITTATADAQIRWTTDGSAPTATTGMAYTGPIPVDRTTCLRAAAFRPDWLPSDVDTHTYLFLDQVLQQPDVQPGYPTVWQASYPADYGMDSNVVNSPNYGPTLKEDLRSIPVLSIVTTHSNLWHSSNGIYNNATSEGPLWERPASVELIDPDGSTAFAVNCGIQMQGNASRDNVRTPKHALRLLFKSRYGPTRLNYDWFNGGVDQFNTIVLRACFTDSWSTRYSDSELVPGFPWRGQRYRPEDSLLLRDVWVKDSLRDMGWLAGRGTFVHLYLNGLYWGVYNPTERLDAEFFASHLGGRPEDWDVIRDFTELLDGSMSDWNRMMAYVNAGITSESAYHVVAAQVDIANLIDYMLLHCFAEAEDWPHHNWYAAHRRATNGLPATRWIFLPWDQEIVLDQLVRRNRTDVSNDNTPARIYSQLRAWPEFRRLFGDRIQKHLFNDGALTPARNQARLTARAAEIDRAIVGESARWGDAREFPISPNLGHGQTFTRDEWWMPELQKLATHFFPALTEENLNRFRAAGLYPSLSAPRFSQFGGAVSAGFELTLTHSNPGGTIYYTLDGTDPRQYGSGVPAPTAQAYSTPIPFPAPTRVRARVLSANQWSALVEATFYPPQDLTRLALTEIMYHPPSAGATNSGEFEFLELKNSGSLPLDLSGLAFTRGIDFTFPLATLLPPGGFALLGRNPTAFATKYPGVPLAGLFTGRLDDGGETLTLSHPSGAEIFSVSYGDRAPWPVTADGFGFSLVPIRPDVTPPSNDGAKWRASSQPGGSPGVDDPEPARSSIVIHELLSHTDPPQRDAVELHNPTENEADLGGWYLSDDATWPRKFRIPPGTVISAGGYRVFDELDFNPAPGVDGSFAFDSTGDSAYLFSANLAGELTGYSHGFDFGAAFNGVSFGRHVNSIGEESFPSRQTVTLNQPNSDPRIGPVVLNEIHYHPAPGDDEFIELLNLTSDPVPLFHPGYPTNTWRLRGLAYTFPPGLFLGPNAMLLLVASDPEGFREQHAVPADVMILGPFTGTLQDSGERLDLAVPDVPNVDAVPYVAVESVRYHDQPPWPAAAAGAGASLQRISPARYADDPASWLALTPTPGRSTDSLDTDVDGLPDAWELEHGTNPFRPDNLDDPDEDGASNGAEYIAGTDPLDPGSVLRLGWATTTEGQGRLEFVAHPGRSHTLETTDQLNATAWVVATNWPAADVRVLRSLPVSVTAAPARYFRLRAELP
jgi:hypothetical protein